MTGLDQNVVRRWFEEFVMPLPPGQIPWGVVPNRTEQDVIRHAAAALLGAVRPADQPADRPGADRTAERPEADLAYRAAQVGDRLDRPGSTNLGEVDSRLGQEVPAALAAYLGAVAAGIAGSRAVFAGAVGLDERGGADDQAQPGPAATRLTTVGSGHLGLAAGDHGGTAQQAQQLREDAMCLAAGLMAGAAALAARAAVGSVDARLGRSAAEAAGLAGLAATDLAVDGAGLHRVAAQAAATAAQGWHLGVRAADDQHGADSDDHRLRALLCRVLTALDRATAGPIPVARPADCGALPGDAGGVPFPAEVSFTMELTAAAARELRSTLAGLGAEVTLWPQREPGARPESGGEISGYAFHLHRPAGRVGVGSVRREHSFRPADQPGNDGAGMTSR